MEPKGKDVAGTAEYGVAIRTTLREQWGRFVK
jgi:hypothetical protein